MRARRTNVPFEKRKELMSVLVKTARASFAASQPADRFAKALGATESKEKADGLKMSCDDLCRTVQEAGTLGAIAVRTGADVGPGVLR